MWPLPIVYEIGQDHWKVKSSSYISSPKDALIAVNSEADRSGIALTMGRHELVEFGHYSQIEESARSRKWL